MKKNSSRVELPVIQPNSFINGDCMEFMRTCPPNFFDLAIVDPPYGIGNFVQATGNIRGKKVTWNDSPPTDEYFIQLERISKEQIIWGANYYNCFNGKRGAIVWHKDQPMEDFSQCEIASYSRLRKVWYYKQTWTNFVNTKDTRHACEKPVELYKWLLEKFAKAGDLIFDSHVGSGSSLVACIEKGFDYVGFEIDKEYYTMAKSRLGRATRKYELFEAV